MILFQTLLKKNKNKNYFYKYLLKYYLILLIINLKNFII